MDCTDTVCGTGGWSGPLPGDPDNNSILSAVPAYGGIELSWTLPTINSHAVSYINIFRGVSNDPALSIRRVAWKGNYFFDRIPATEVREYFYWIQIISINGTPGELIGPVSTVPMLTVTETIAQLSGLIDDGILAESLRSKLGEIALLQGQLATEIANRLTSDTAMATALEAVQSETGQALTYINSEITQRQASDEALLDSVNTLAVGMGDNAAAIANEALLRATADSAIALQVSTAQATLGDSIASVETTMGAAISAVGDDIDSIGALYTAKVNVNGLIGGFGIYNDGSEVEAGFDVDRFWIGRATDKTKPFIIDNGVVYIAEAAIPLLHANKIDTRNLTIKDDQGNVLFGSGTNLDWGFVAGTEKPADGATRNVFKGTWSQPTVYVVGDSVIKDGYGWSCISNHTSSAVIMPPVYPVTSNTQWVLSAVAGTQALTVVLSNESHTLPADADGVVGSYVGSGTTVQVFEGATALTASASATASAFRIGAPTQLPVATITPGGISYAGSTATVANHSAMVNGTDMVAVTLPITVYRADGTSSVIYKVQSITKSKAGVIGVNGAQGIQGIQGIQGSDGTSGTDGLAGATISLDSTGQAFTYTDNVAAPAVQSLTFTANTNGLAARRNALDSSETFPITPWYHGVSLGGGLGFYTTTDSTEVSHPTKSTDSVKKYVATATTNELFLRYAANFPIGKRTLSIYIYVPVQSGVTSWGFLSDYADANAGNVQTSSVFGKWVRVSSVATLSATRGWVDFNIYRNGATPTTGFTFYATCAQEEAGDLSSYQKMTTNYGELSWTTTPAVTLTGTDNSRSLSLSDFGTNSEVVVKASVGGAGSDSFTVSRLNKSTADAGATVGATIGTNLGGKITPDNASTFIADGAIQTAQIGNATITDAHIDRASVNKLQVVTADIANAQITSEKIGDAQITNAKIGTAEISTLKVQGNSITVSAGGSFAYRGNLGTNVQVLSLSLNFPVAPQSVSIIYSVKTYGAATNVVATLYRGATALDSIRVFDNSSEAINPMSAAFVVNDTPGAGAFTYTVKLSSAGGFSMMCDGAAVVLGALR